LYKKDVDARDKRGHDGHGARMMMKIKDLHRKWMKDLDYRKEYEALEEEFALAAEVVKARRRAPQKKRTGAAVFHNNRRDHILG